MSADDRDDDEELSSRSSRRRRRRRVDGWRGCDGAEGAEGVPEVSRKIRRRRRRTRPRSKTIAMKRLTREELRVGALMYPPVDIPRPTSREECRGEHAPVPVGRVQAPPLSRHQPGDRVDQESTSPTSSRGSSSTRARSMSPSAAASRSKRSARS